MNREQAKSKIRMSVIVDGKHINSLKKANECIDKIFDEHEAQLREAMKPKTCDGCAFNFLSPTDIGLLRQSQCFLCVRNTEEVKDHYELKDNA